MKALTRTVALVVALATSSASLADETLYPPWDGWDSWRDGDATVGWDFGYETGTLDDTTVVVDLVAAVIGVAWTNQWCWNYQTWTAPGDDYYRFTFNYNASGWASLSGASLFGDTSWITMKVVLRIIPSWTTWEEGPFWYNYWRCVAATSGIPYIPTPPYEYDEDVHVTTPPIWFDEGETVTIGGGIQIQPTCIAAIGFVSALAENTGQLNSVQIVRENPPTPILAVDPDPPAHVFGQQTRLGPVEWTFNIWNSGTGTLNWDVNSDSGWISLSPESGDSTGEWDPVTVTVDTASLPLGPHGGFIHIESNAGSDLGFIGITIINVPPGADAGGPYSGIVDEDILFDASGSVDGDGTITGYRWDWDNNGTWDTGWLGSPTTTHSFSASGSHTVALQVQDNDGDTGDDTCVCNIDILSALVEPDGSGDFPTIQAAIDAAAEGAVILLADGTFYGDGNRDIDFLGKAITVRSQSNNPESCIINCQGSEEEPHRGFYFHTGEGSDSLLQGVTITNGYAYGSGLEGFGGGLLCDYASPAIANCRFLTNSAEADGGVAYCNHSQSEFTDCSFVENSTSGSVAGIMFDSAGQTTLSGCTFTGNVGTSLYFIYGSGSATITNCDFIDEEGYSVIYIDEADVAIVDCVFLRNGRPIICWDGSLAITDSIFLQNQSVCGGLHAIRSSVAVTGCLFAGNASDLWGVITHQESETAIEIENTLVVFSSAGPAVFCRSGATATLNCCDIYGNAGGDYVGCIADQYGVNGNISEDPLFCDPENDDFHILDISPCAPAQQPSCGLIGALGVGCVQHVYLISPDGSGDHPTIQAAVDAATDHDIIELTDGAFIGPGNRDIDFLGKAIPVRSQSGNPTACVIDCLGVARGFSFQTGEEADSVLQGVTIKNGSAAQGGGIRCSYASPTIRNCVIAENAAGTEGGGLYCEYASPALTNCLFHGNTATLMGGGLICYSSDPVLTNCTLSGNSAGSQGGGLWLGYSDPTLTNCILWSNTPEEVYVYSGTPDITYCDVQGGWAGSGNIDANPLFVPGPGGYLYLSHIATGQTQQSPCVDAGNDTAENLFLDGLTTRRDEVADTGIVDMGYHYPLTGETFVLGDFNGDGDVGLADFAEFWDCLTGPCTDSPCEPLYTDPCCGTGDFDGDADVDLEDFAGLQEAFTG